MLAIRPLDGSGFAVEVARLESVSLDIERGNPSRDGGPADLSKIGKQPASAAGLLDGMQLPFDPPEMEGRQMRGDEGRQLVAGQQVPVAGHLLLDKPGVARDFPEGRGQGGGRHEHERQTQGPRHLRLDDRVDMAKKDLGVFVDVILVRAGTPANHLRLGPAGRAFAQRDAVRLADLLVNDVAADEPGPRLGGRERQRFEPPDGELPGRRASGQIVPGFGRVDDRHAARQGEHRPPLERRGQSHEWQHVETVGDKRKRRDRPLEHEAAGQAVGREDRQAVVGVLPECMVPVEHAEGMQEPLDFGPWPGACECECERLDEVAIPRPIDPVFRHVAVGRQIERQAGGGLRPEERAHAVFRQRFPLDPR